MTIQAKSTLVRDLESQESEVQASINSAVLTGGDSSKLRGQLNVVQGKLQAARADVAAMEAASRDAAEQIANQCGTAISAEVLVRIESALIPFNIPEITEMTSKVHPIHVAAIEAAGLNLAHAKQVHAEAHANHVDAQRAADEVAARLQAVNNRRAEITETRVAGDTSQDLANEFAALAADAASLQTMLAAERSKAAGIEPGVNAAAQGLRDREKALALAEAAAVASTLTDRVRLIEEIYVAALRGAQAAHQRAGKPGMGGEYQPGQILRAYAQTGVLQAAQFGR